MNRFDLQKQIPEAIAKLHSDGQPAAFYNEITCEVLRNNERRLARRTAVRNLLSKVHIDYPLIPEYPLSPLPSKVYPALLALEADGIVEGRFQNDRADGKRSRRMYRLARDIDFS